MHTHNVLRAARCVVGAAIVLTLVGGCESAQQGAVSGGAVGALSGLAIGSITGDAGAGAAIGAIAGAVGGAVIGDQNRREREMAEAEKQAAASPSAPRPVRYEAAPLLDRLIGRWTIDGWLLDSAGERVKIAGTATGAAEKSFFLRLDIRLTDPRSDEKIEGTSIISQEGGHALAMNNSFSTSPAMKRFTGEADRSGEIMTFRETGGQSGSTSRRVVFRFSGSDRWSTEGWERRAGSDVMTESLTFTRAR